MKITLTHQWSSVPSSVWEGKLGQSFPSTSEKGSSKDFIAHCWQAPRQCPAMQLWLQVFHVQVPLTWARWKFKEWDSVYRKSFQKKTCLETWGAVCSYLCWNHGRTVSWTDLREVVRADMPHNWNLRADGLLSVRAEFCLIFYLVSTAKLKLVE